MTLKVITSVKNPLIVKTRRIKSHPKDYIFLEGLKLIKEAILGGYALEYLLISKDIYPNFFKSNPKLGLYKHYVVAPKILESLSDVTSPQGVIGIVKFKEKTLREPRSNFLVLENIQDAGNVGTIIRSASGTSFKDIFLIGSANWYSPKVIRSSAGRIFKCNLFTFKSLEDFLKFKKKYNLKLIATTMDGENLFEIKNLRERLGIVIGNEGKGISKTLKENCFKSVSIPMKNNLQSLNAGVSCSVIIYYLDNMLDNIKGEKNGFGR